MEVTPALVAYLMAAGLLLLSSYYAWQQFQALRSLRAKTQLPPLDRAYIRNQAWLRLACCTIMVGLGALVAGAYAFGLEEDAQELGRVVQAQRAQGEFNLSAEQRQFRRFYGGYWITVLVLLLLIVLLAGIDIWSIRRYGRRHLRQIEADRREMLQQEVVALRSQRNGHV